MDLCAISDLHDADRRDSSLRKCLSSPRNIATRLHFQDLIYFWISRAKSLYFSIKFFSQSMSLNLQDRDTEDDIDIDVQVSFRSSNIEKSVKIYTFRQRCWARSPIDPVEAVFRNQFLSSLTQFRVAKFLEYTFYETRTSTHLQRWWSILKQVPDSPASYRLSLSLKKKKLWLYKISRIQVLRDSYIYSRLLITVLFY